MPGHVQPAFPGPVDPVRRAAFVAAERHSRLVRFLRLALPSVSVAVVFTVAAIGILSRIEIALTIGDVKISAEGLTMDAPKLSGSDGKGRTFSVVAERAVQDLSNPKLIRLRDIVATVRQPDGSSAEFRAGGGLYDAGRQRLSLDEAITIRGSDGSAADLEHAEIDLVTGEVASDAPVSFSSSLGAISADGMQVGEKGGTVTFDGGVKMTVDPNAVNTGPGDLFRPRDETETKP
jgi:lipopolysaccharide export system protein LptC